MRRPRGSKYHPLQRAKVSCLSSNINDIVCSHLTLTPRKWSQWCGERIVGFPNNMTIMLGRDSFNNVFFEMDWLILPSTLIHDPRRCKCAMRWLPNACRIFVRIDESLLIILDWWENKRLHVSVFLGESYMYMYMILYWITTIWNQLQLVLLFDQNFRSFYLSEFSFPIKLQQNYRFDH